MCWYECVSVESSVLKMICDSRSMSFVQTSRSRPAPSSTRWSWSATAARWVSPSLAPRSPSTPSSSQAWPRGVSLRGEPWDTPTLNLPIRDTKHTRCETKQSDVTEFNQSNLTSMAQSTFPNSSLLGRILAVFSHLVNLVSHIHMYPPQLFSN